MSETVREHSLRIRMTEEEKAMLRTLKDALGVSASDWIRMAVRKSFAELPAAERRKIKK